MSEDVLSRMPSPSNNGRDTAMLFEVSWETCCQVGGIYTVLRSKTPAAVRRWGDGYWLIGPYREASAKIEVEPVECGGVVGEAIRELRDEGTIIRTGRWLVTGRPQVLLADLESVNARAGEMKYYLWKDHGIATTEHDYDVTGAVMLGYVVADLLEAIHRRIGDRPMMAHFHEWQAGAALPILRHRKTRFPTVFTTHATLVGRTLSAANVDLYDHLPAIDADAVAREYGFTPRFEIERAAAQAADVFTTVSGITAIESEQFLGRKPDLLLPNGLNIDRFAAPYEFQNLHRQNKELIHEFTMGHFFPSYTFDLDKTLYIFTAGRYEYRNKGFDVFIEALHQLNQWLKAEPNGTTVVAFIIAPAPCRSLNMLTLNRQAMFHDLRDTCEAITGDVGRRLFRIVAQGRLPTTEDLLDEYRRVQLKRLIHAWRQGPLPTIVTHDLLADGSDRVLAQLRHRGLVNAPDDPVKVVFHPEFITSTSPVLGLEYDQFVRGCNMGVFPSYYEPWGYTPMECVVRGIPTITSDLSGFGAYITSHFADHDDNGIHVARRRDVSFDNTVSQVAHWLNRLTRMTRRERIEQRNRVERHAEHFDWSHLTRYYRAARRWAFGLHYPGRAILPSEDDLEYDADEPPRRPLPRGRDEDDAPPRRANEVVADDSA